jgi:hypothetical protein
LLVTLSWKGLLIHSFTTSWKIRGLKIIFVTSFYGIFPFFTSFSVEFWTSFYAGNLVMNLHAEYFNFTTL